MKMENKILIALTIIFLACFIGGMMTGCASRWYEYHLDSLTSEAI